MQHDDLRGRGIYKHYYIDGKLDSHDSSLTQLSASVYLNASGIAVNASGIAVNASGIATLDSRLDVLLPGGASNTYGVDDILALESAMRSPGVGTAPSTSTWNTNFSLYLFPNSAARYLQSAVQLPHSYQNGSDLYWHVHFVNATGVANTETIIWKADIVTAPYNSAFVTATTYTSTFTAATAHAVNSHLLTTGVAVDGSALGDSSFVVSRIYRDVSDTYDGDVYLLGSDFHARKDSMGTSWGA